MGQHVYNGFSSLLFEARLAGSCCFSGNLAVVSTSTAISGDSILPMILTYLGLGGAASPNSARAIVSRQIR